MGIAETGFNGPVHSDCFEHLDKSYQKGFYGKEENRVFLEVYNVHGPSG